MWTVTRRIIPLILALAVFTFGCRKKATEEVDFGTFTNAVFTNQYFGVTLTVPQDWSIQDQEARDRLAKMGTAAIVGDDKTMKATLKAAQQQTVNMFSVFQHPLGTPVAFNPSVIGVAERVRDLPGIKRGSDYHFQVKKMMESGQMKVSFPRESYTALLGGVEFDVLDQEIEVRGKVIKQRYFTIIKKGYALSFATTFTTDKEEAATRKVLDTLAFF